ncbi:hypothetical protein [Rhizobium sp. Leaf341]|uniref:hypothetical protein n=1 Tax=Rhizobium sp. Leaf341 TaxID=1736344 RepID=UPI000715C407|nr:hypothetical protein [Rhizobium sp. Leaf341]KQR75767.1 hypothetical protein ASG03_19040 [Rhizobium sp. Leaf341]
MTNDDIEGTESSLAEGGASSDAPRPVNSYSQGYALCNAAGVLVGHTYRSTAEAAIEAHFPSSDPAGAEKWAEMQALGWTVEHVYAHVFKPRFMMAATRVDQTASEESA